MSSPRCLSSAQSSQPQPPSLSLSLAELGGGGWVVCCQMNAATQTKLNQHRPRSHARRPRSACCRCRLCCRVASWAVAARSQLLFVVDQPCARIFMLSVGSPQGTSHTSKGTVVTTDAAVRAGLCLRLRRGRSRGAGVVLFCVCCPCAGMFTSAKLMRAPTQGAACA